MWGRLAPIFSRQVVEDAWSSGSRCTCHAKRYLPARRQHKGPSGGSKARRTPPVRQPADPEDLLRELNSGGVGWLLDEEEGDWGLDDVAEHARARQEQHLQRYGGSTLRSGITVSPSGADAGARRRRSVSGGSGGSILADATAGEPHGSPLESGLASISREEDAYEVGVSGRGGDGSGGSVKRGPAAAAAVNSGSGRGMTGGVLPAAAAAVAATQAVTVPPETSRRSRTTVELDASYARRNPEIVQALRLRGVVRQPDGEAVDELNDGGGVDLNPGLEPVDDFGLSDEDDSLNLHLDSDFTAAEDVRDLTSGSSCSSSSSSRGGRSGDARTGLGGAPSCSHDWYSSLAAAGFSVRANAAGEVFLERTVRRKAITAADAAKPIAPTPATSTAAAAAGREGPAPEPLLTVVAAAGRPLPPPPLVLPIEPMTSRPAVVAALQCLITPQQVLDFLELSYPQWAANGCRLVDVRSGRPVAAPTPAEAAHCLRALALTARRSEIGGWRCLELSAARQAQGLAEALRVTPPRLLPEQATPQLSAAYFDAARRFWLDPTGDPIIDNPRGGGAPSSGGGGRCEAGAESSLGRRPHQEGEQTSPRLSPSVGTTAAAAAAVGTSAVVVEPAAAASGDEDGFSTKAPPACDPVYDSLVAKYAAVSKFQQQPQLPPPQQPQPMQRPQQQPKPFLNGHASAAAVVAAVAVARTEKDKAIAASLTGPPNAVLPAAAAPAAEQDATAAAAARRRAAKIECLVSALWAMSSLGGPPYFQAEVEAVVTILARCLASAAGQPRPSPAGAAAAAAAAAAPGGLSGWQAGQVLWSLGNSRHMTPRLADLEASIMKSGGLSSVQPRDLTRVLWGFASLGYQPERLLLTIKPDWSWRERTAVVSDERSTGPGQGLRSRRGCKARGTGSRQQLCGDVRSFTPQQLAGAVWALAVMEQVDTGPFRSAWAQLLQRASEVPHSEAVLTQIWQANLAVHLESSLSSSPSSLSSSPSPSSQAPLPPPPSSSPAVAADAAAAAAAGSSPAGGRCSGRGGSDKKGAKPVAVDDLTAAGLAAAAGGSGGDGGLDLAAARALLLRSRDAFLAATSGLRRKVQSGYQRQMANTLTGLRLMHLLEDNSAGYSIDITLPQLRIALEADGPTHTSRTPGGAMLGATAMKRRHLQRMGWHVVNVTYKEWDKLTSESARRTFLQERINQALLGRIRIGDEDQEDDGRR